MKTISKFLTILVILAVLLGGLPTRTAHAGPGDTVRASVASDGTESNHESYNLSISGDGRYVAFESLASNLVSGDTNSTWDIFLRDLQAGTTSRVSLASDGTEADDESRNPSVSSDGRYVAFHSTATNLVAGDTNAQIDIFVRDVFSGTTTRVSVASDGTQADSNSYNPSISADGRYVVFDSYASNLVTGDTNGTWDIFVHDLQTGTTTRVSVASDGTEGNGESHYPDISGDGRYVTFFSYASNLVSGDANSKADVFVRDLQMGTTSRVSVASDGTEGNDGSVYSSISTDGRFVAFMSYAANLVSGDANGKTDIFLHDRETGITTRISAASDGTESDADSRYPSVSADGQFIAFDSFATNLVAGDTNAEADIFVHNRLAGNTTRVSVASDGAQADLLSYAPSISADGRYAAFLSGATNLVAGDTNNSADIFVHDNAVPVVQAFTSMGAYDGWILESSENSNKGGTLDKNAPTFNLGDGAQDKQYRAVLSFNTATLPDSLVITKATLKIKKQGLVGTNPFNLLGGLKVDIISPYYGVNVELAASDFQAKGGRSAAATFGAVPVGNWYSAVLGAAGRAYLNPIGTTQVRLRFATDDNNDNGADYMKFYSGNAGAANRPQLIIEFYYLP